MAAAKQYRQMFIAVESCQGGALGADLNAPGAMLLSAASPVENSLSANYDASWTRGWPTSSRSSTGTRHSPSPTPSIRCTSASTSTSTAPTRARTGRSSGTQLRSRSATSWGPAERAHRPPPRIRCPRVCQSVQGHRADRGPSAQVDLGDRSSRRPVHRVGSGSRQAAGQSMFVARMRAPPNPDRPHHRVGR